MPALMCVLYLSFTKTRLKQVNRYLKNALFVAVIKYRGEGVLENPFLKNVQDIRF